MKSWERWLQIFSEHTVILPRQTMPVTVLAAPRLSLPGCGPPPDTVAHSTLQKASPAKAQGSSLTNPAGQCTVTPHHLSAMGQKGCDKTALPERPTQSTVGKHKAKNQGAVQMLQADCYPCCRLSLQPLLSEQGILPTIHTAGQSSRLQETPPWAANPTAQLCDTAVCVLGRMGGLGGRKAKLEAYTEK